MSGKTCVRSIVFSTDGTILAIGIMDTILLFDPATGKKLGQLEAEAMGQVTGMGFTPDGSKLVSGSEHDGRIRIWDVTSHKVLHSLDGRMFLGRSMALSPDGKTVALGTVGHTVRLWDVATGKELFTEYQGHDSQINSLAFSPDGKTLVSAGDFRQTFLWNAATRRRSGILAGSARTLSYSPAGKQLATVAANSSDNSKKVRIWDVAAGKVELTITVPDAWDVSAAIISPDGRKLFTLDHTPDKSGYAKAHVRHWDVATGKQDHSWPVPQEVSWRATLAPDGKTLIAALQTGGISIYNAESRRKRYLHSEPMEWHSTLSPDGRILASGMSGPNSAVRLWELVTGKEIALLKGHQGSVAVIAWSPDGRLLASGDERNDRRLPQLAQTVRLWDAASGNELARFGGFQSDVTALTFSPDGTSLVAGLRDSTILIWEVGQLMPAPVLTRDELESGWTDLIGDNVRQAHKSIGELVAASGQAAPFLQSKLKPVVVADAGKIKQWIGDLNSEVFSVRHSATQQLVKLDAQAQSPLQAALKGNVSLETRRRLEQILDAISDNPDPGAVRTSRAIMVLERIGSPETQAVLEALARGAPGARATEDAQASLKRLAKRASSAAK